MNLKPYNLPPETTSPLLRSQSGLVPRGSAPQDSTVVYMLQWVCVPVCARTCVCICPRQRCTAAPLSSSQTHLSCSKSSPSVIRNTDTQAHTHTHTCIHTKGHIWTGLAHSTFYTNVGDKSSVIECACVQLFSSSNNLRFVSADHRGPSFQSLNLEVS